MNELSLFSGVGGGLLASKYFLNWRTIGYVEFEDYPQRVLAQRIKDGLLDEAPIFGDIRAFISEGYAESYQGMVDVVSGGFPCQDISCAGTKTGLNGERSGLWNEMADVIRIVRPKFVFVENSPALVIRGLGTVLRDLAQMGFSAKWGCVSAKCVGAPHLRRRFWLVADSGGDRISPDDVVSQEGTNMGIHNKSDRKDSWIEVWIKGKARNELQINQANPESIICRGSDGDATWMDRLKGIGNGQVPQVAATAWHLLTGGRGNDTKT